MEITALELQEKINKGEKIIVEFWAPWCGPCRMMKPKFEKVASENITEVQLYTMDIENNKDYVVSLGVKSIPTLKVFNQGGLVETKVGVLQEQQIKGIVDGLILN
jgi:thioredoxin 1